jgi:hypothetical protein
MCLPFATGGSPELIDGASEKAITIQRRAGRIMPKCAKLDRWNHSCGDGDGVKVVDKTFRSSDSRLPRQRRPTLDPAPRPSRQSSEPLHDTAMQNYQICPGPDLNARNRDATHIGGSVRARRDGRRSRSVNHSDACAPIDRRLRIYEDGRKRSAQVTQIIRSCTGGMYRRRGRRLVSRLACEPCRWSPAARKPYRVPVDLVILVCMPAGYCLPYGAWLVRASSSASRAGVSPEPICWNIPSARRRNASAWAARPSAMAHRPRPASA